MRNRLPLLLILLIAGAMLCVWLAQRAGDETPVLPGNSGSGNAPPDDVTLTAESEAGERSTEIETSEPVVTEKGEVVFVKVGGPSEVFSGFVRDARTDEPVPELTLDIVDEYGKDDQVVTDTEGKFETTQEFAAGRLWVEPDDDGRWYERFDFDLPEPGAKVEIALKVGPTYRVRFDMPDGVIVTDFNAELLRAKETTIPALFGWKSQRLRPGDVPWVRFHPDQANSAGPPWRLTVLSEDGFFYGEGRVDANVGISPDVLVIDLEQRATLRYRVREKDGNAIAAFLPRLVSLDGVTVADTRNRIATDDTIFGVPPGTYRLHIASPRHEPWSRDVHLVAGEVELVHVELLPIAGYGKISGTVTTASGKELRSDPFLLARRVETPDVLLRAAFEWKTAGERAVGSFEFERLPPGEYDVELSTPRAAFQVTPRTQRVAVPASGISFHVLDDAARLPLRFEVTDAETGASIEPYSAWCMPKGNYASFERILGPKDVLGVFPDGVELDWVVTAEGYGLAAGGREDLRIEGDELVSRVALTPGWGGQFFVSEKDAGRYVSGIRVLLDGEYAGTTEGEFGRLRVTRKERPERISLDSREWRLAPGSEVDPHTGLFAESSWWAISVDVERRD